MFRSEKEAFRETKIRGVFQWHSQQTVAKILDQSTEEYKASTLRKVSERMSTC